MITDPAAPPPVVPAGTMAGGDQPVLPLPGRDLVLRPWTPHDAPALLAAGNDPAIRHWNLFSVPDLADAERRIARMHHRWREESAALWAIADGHHALGLIGWTDIDLAAGTAEIVYWALPAARGGGIVTDAVRRATAWALDDLGLHRLRLCHSVANPASCRVATRTGYPLEGTMRSALHHADGWHDQHLHAHLAGDPRP
ncbi:GNAT family N-acetyltransferase [Kitasatospora sp. NPDC048365]|uniref:GNAT family N-acetyltransferase n=1 Tax=Kitasatospora sp. NPDC048365 TaxID=3364050 RepID=UPI003711F3C2